MSDEEKESSGLGFLLALGGAAAAIYTAYKVFMKPEVEEIELKYSSFMPIRVQDGLLDAAVSLLL
jgi:hypothetical protein